jgi:hypothetical protein
VIEIVVHSGPFPQFTELELVVAAIAQLFTASDRNS